MPIADALENLNIPIQFQLIVPSLKASHYWRKTDKAMCEKITEIVIAKEASKKKAAISLSHTAVQTKISDMGKHIKLWKRYVQHHLVCSQFSWMNQWRLNLALNLWLLSDVHTGKLKEKFLFCMYSSKEYN